MNTATRLHQQLLTATEQRLAVAIAAGDRKTVRRLQARLAEMADFTPSTTPEQPVVTRDEWAAYLKG